MWFHSWASIVRVLVLGSVGYVALVVLLRVSGKRTLSKMNAFDFVVTIALGSTFASLLLTRSVTLADGVTALALLVGLQYVVSWLAVRSSRVQSIVKSQPRLLYWRGTFMDVAMRRERITEAEIEAALRESGVGSPARTAVVLETDGSLTALEVGPDASDAPLEHVRGRPE